MEMRKGWAEHQPREHPTSTEIGNETWSLRQTRTAPTTYAYSEYAS
jgi:hypothetical protein